MSYIQAYTEVPSTPLHTASVLKDETENWQDMQVLYVLYFKTVDFITTGNIDITPYTYILTQLKKHHLGPFLNVYCLNS